MLLQSIAATSTSALKSFTTGFRRSFGTWSDFVRGFQRGVRLYAHPIKGTLLSLQRARNRVHDRHQTRHL
jgi:hypothetical protein